MDTVSVWGLNAVTAQLVGLAQVTVTPTSTVAARAGRGSITPTMAIISVRNTIAPPSTRDDVRSHRDT